MTSQIRQRNLYRVISDQLAHPLYVAAQNQLEAIDSAQQVHETLNPGQCSVEYVAAVLT